MTAGRILLSAAVAAGLCLMAAAPASAQPYPNRPSNLIVPFAPGGRCHRASGRGSVVVGARATGHHREPPRRRRRHGRHQGGHARGSDGYTLTLASPGPITVAPAVYKNLDYDPIKQLVPIAMIATSPFVLVVNPEVPGQIGARTRGLQQG